MSVRTEYNKVKYEYQRKQRELLAKFKAEHPERYAELMIKAQQEIEAEKSQPYLKLQHVEQPVAFISEEQLKANSERINKILEEVRAGRKDYFIDVEVQHDGWIETHRYFTLLRSSNEASEVVQRKYGMPSNVKIVRVQVCTCPLCK